MIVYLKAGHQAVPQGAVGIILHKNNRAVYCEFDLTGMNVSWADSDNPITVTCECDINDIEEVAEEDVQISGAVQIVAIAKNRVGAMYQKYIGQIGLVVRKTPGVVWLEMENEKDVPFVLGAVKLKESAFG